MVSIGINGLCCDNQMNQSHISGTPKYSPMTSPSPSESSGVATQHFLRVISANSYSTYTGALSKIPTVMLQYALQETHVIFPAARFDARITT